MTHSPTPTELLALRTANAAVQSSPDTTYDIVATAVFALGSAQLLQSPELVAEQDRIRNELWERLGDVVRERDTLTALVSELEAAAYGDAPVRLLEPVAQIGHLRDCVAAQKHRADTLNRLCREQRQRADAAEARVAELEAAQSQPAPMLDTATVAAAELVRAEHYNDAARLLEGASYDDDAVNFLDAMGDGIREVAVDHRASAEDPHDSPLHHAYSKGRDLPVPCAECQEPSPGGRAFCSTRCRNAADRHDADDHLAEETTHAEL